MSHEIKVYLVVNSNIISSNNNINSMVILVGRFKHCFRLQIGVSLVIVILVVRASINHCGGHGSYFGSVEPSHLGKILRACYRYVFVGNLSRYFPSMG